MADERISEATPGVVETTDRGLFDFMKKKEDESKPASSEYDNINSGVEKVHISEPEYKEEHHHYEEKKHESLGEKLHRSNSSSSSSSSDEEGDDEEKKRRRKERKEKKKGGIKEKIEEKFGHHDHKEEKHHEHDTNVPIEKIHVQENVYSEPSYTTHAHDHHEEEKKKGGFMDKIKDKLPGQHGDEEHKVAAPVVSHTHEEVHGAEEEKEKKGFLDKIKEKIPGFHSKNGAEEKKEHDHHEEKKEGY
uniref:Dehydrin n=1 Tax=Suaeda glauca TaxID=397272 RepID=H8YHV1_9CARY|nr:dehydrin [Suaeda glauca]